MNKDLEIQIKQLENDLAALTGQAYPDIVFIACGGWVRPLPESKLVEAWLKECGLHAVELRIQFDVREEITFSRIHIPVGYYPPNTNWYQVVIPGRINPDHISIDWCHPTLNKRYKEWKQQRIVDK
ncbi:hypothetical protein G6687_02360 [Polynucleobacter paneuropaeus]|nr:hypothetical protein G6687_02360 [Polynucleobacter paneuropaeus]